MANPVVSSVMDVIVVGCGASGAAALRRLHAAGLRVLALEAADRIGGRIDSVPFGGGVVDLGAQWCHGEKDNAVFEQVKDLGVLDRPQPEEQVFLLSDGSSLPADVGKSFVDQFNSILDNADKKSKQSIPEYLRTAVKSSDALNYQELTSPLLEWFERFNHVGGQDNPKRSKSLFGLEEGWPCDGEFLLNWKNKGYRTVLDILLNSHQNPQDKIPVDILLNKEVKTIKWRRMKDKADPTNPLVQLKCTDGSLYEAQCVIVTVSVGVLQERHAQMFTPPLPEDKVNAINNLQLCILNKIYVLFTEPWWPKSPCNYSIVWRPEDKAKLAEEFWWVTEVYGLTTVEHQPNLLCVWIYGEGAKAMEKVSVEEVRAGVLKILDIFFKNYDVSQIEDVKRSQWSSNPLARGAYSYRCMDTELRGGSAAVLSEPLYYRGSVPTVCFAGEATSHHHHGAVHGAVEAGFREAQRIIDSMKK